MYLISQNSRIIVNNEEEKCVKQFEAFKKALLAEEKFFDFSKEVE